MAPADAGTAPPAARPAGTPGQETRRQRGRAPQRPWTPMHTSPTHDQWSAHNGSVQIVGVDAADHVVQTAQQAVRDQTDVVDGQHVGSSLVGVLPTARLLDEPDVQSQAGAQDDGDGQHGCGSRKGRQPTDVMQWRFHTTRDHEKGHHGKRCDERSPARSARRCRTNGSSGRHPERTHAAPPRSTSSAVRAACLNAAISPDPQRCRADRCVCSAGKRCDWCVDGNGADACCTLDFVACASAIRSDQSTRRVPSDPWRPFS